MNWSKATAAPITDVSELDELDVSDLEAEAREQFEAAKAAAVAVIESGALGSGYRFNVGLSGHANPDHAPRDGYANDTVALTVTQALPVPVGQPVDVVVEGAPAAVSIEGTTLEPTPTPEPTPEPEPEPVPSEPEDDDSESQSTED